MDDSEIGKKAWEIVRAYLESATPAQWHLFAAGSNYDDNAPGLLGSSTTQTWIAPPRC